MSNLEPSGEGTWSSLPLSLSRTFYFFFSLYFSFFFGWLLPPLPVDGCFFHLLLMVGVFLHRGGRLEVMKRVARSNKVMDLFPWKFGLYLLLLLYLNSIKVFPNSNFSKYEKTKTDLNGDLEKGGRSGISDQKASLLGPYVTSFSFVSMIFSVLSGLQAKSEAALLVEALHARMNLGGLAQLVTLAVIWKR